MSFVFDLVVSAMRAAKKTAKAAAKAAARPPAQAVAPPEHESGTPVPLWITANCPVSHAQGAANTVGNRGYIADDFIASLGPITVLEMPVDGALTTALFDDTEPVPEVMRKNYYIPRVDRVAAQPEAYDVQPQRRGRNARQARAIEQRQRHADDMQRAAARRARDRAEESDEEQSDEEDDRERAAPRAGNAARAVEAPHAAAVRAAAMPAAPRAAMPRADAHDDEQVGPPHATENDRWFWTIIGKFGGADGVSREALERIVNKGVADADRERFRDRYVRWFEHLRVRIEADGFLQGTPSRKLVRPHEIISHCIFQGWAIYSNLSVDMAMLANIVDFKMYFDVHRSINEDLRRGCTDA